MSTPTGDSLDFGNWVFALAATLTHSFYPVFIFIFLFALALSSVLQTRRLAGK